MIAVARDGVMPMLSWGWLLSLRAPRGRPVPVQQPDIVDEKEAKTMGKYLILWEMDETKVPSSRQERGAGWSAFMDMVKQDIKKGMTKQSN